MRRRTSITLGCFAASHRTTSSTTCRRSHSRRSHSTCTCSHSRRSHSRRGHSKRGLSRRSHSKRGHSPNPRATVVMAARRPRLPLPVQGHATYHPYPPPLTLTLTRHTTPTASTPALGSASSMGYRMPPPTSRHAIRTMAIRTLAIRTMAILAMPCMYHGYTYYGRPPHLAHSLLL